MSTFSDMSKMDTSDTIENLLGVDETWLINLDRRPDRLAMMQRQMSQLPFRQINRLSAIDGRQLSNHDIESIVHPNSGQSIGARERNYHEELTHGAVGCYLSHLKLWDYALEHNKKLLILEDDIIFGNDFMQRLVKKAPHLPKDYDMALLAYHLNDRPIVVNEHLVRPHMFFGMSGYLISPTGVQRMRSLLEPIRYQIDGALSFVSPMMNIYAITPPLIRGGINLQSDIQTPMKTRRFLYQQDITPNDIRWILLSIFLGIVVICLIYLLWRRR